MGADVQRGHYLYSDDKLPVTNPLELAEHESSERGVLREPPVVFVKGVRE
jgi:hypothetical protein